MRIDRAWDAVKILLGFAFGLQVGGMIVGHEGLATLGVTLAGLIGIAAILALGVPVVRQQRKEAREAARSGGTR